MSNQTHTLDDVYFCSGCRQFHKDDGTHRVVRIPGVDYITDPVTGKTYKVRQRRAKVKRRKRGFGVF